MFEVNLPVPDTLFTCKTLEFLQLEGCFTLQVPTLVCLPKLQVLKLYSLLGSDESIQKLISGCPMLHSLTINRIDIFVNLPDALFTCKALECLQWKGRFYLRVPSLVCLPKLQVLSLRLLRHGSDESLHRLISGCPVLHTLYIEMSHTIDVDLKISSLSLRWLRVYQDFDEHDLEPDEVPAVSHKKFEIDAPNLEYLDLVVCSNDCSIKGPCASLNKVYLGLPENCIANSYADSVNGVNTDRCNATVKLVETLNRAKCLTLLSEAMMAIGRATIPLSTRFERLTRLDVSVKSSCEWSSLNALLGRCSRLQWLTIIAYKKSRDDPREQWWKEPEQVPECLLSSLTHVCFPNMRGLEDEMPLVRYLLKHGSVLESIDVHYSPEKFQMLEAISKFPRLCSACSVEFTTIG